MYFTINQSVADDSELSSLCVLSASLQRDGEVVSTVASLQGAGFKSISCVEFVLPVSVLSVDQLPVKLTVTHRCKCEWLSVFCVGPATDQ